MRILHPGIRRLSQWFLVLGVVLLGHVVCAQPAENTPSEEAAAFMQTLYGERVRAVQQTRETNDDIELVKEMLDIAPSLPQTPDVRSALYPAVVEIVIKANTGYPLAEAALARLVEHNPRHPALEAQAVLALYESWYRGASRDDRADAARRYFDKLVQAGDTSLDHGEHAEAKRSYNEASSVQRVARLDTGVDLRAKLAEVRELELIDREAGQLKEQAMRGGMSPERTRRLVVLLVLEVGKPGDALPYADALNDPAFVRGLDDAVGLTEELAGNEADRPPRQWYRLGQWYLALADEPRITERATRRALRLAQQSLQRFVGQNQRENVEQAQANIMLRQIESRLAEDAADADQIDVLSLLDPARHTLRGQRFYAVEGKLVLPETSIMHLPIEGGDHYTLTFEVEVAGRGSDAVVVWLPVAGRMARMHIDTASSRRTQINGIGAIPDSEKTMLLERGRPATIGVEVASLPDAEAAIRVSYNGQRTWEWRGDAARFTDPDYGKPPDQRHFAIRAGDDATFSKILLHRADQ